MTCKRSNIITAAVLAVALAGPSMGSTPRSHEDGFFLRMSAGIGSIATSSSGLDFSGESSDFNFALGKMISPNLALHGTIFGWLASDPTVKSGGQDGGEVSTDLDMTGIGGGVTYYFGPSNVYVSGSLGLGRVSASGSDLDGESDLGLAADISGGKEWWLSDNWGMGVALGLGYHHVGNGLEGDPFSGVSGGLRLSVTMN